MDPPLVFAPVRDRVGQRRSGRGVIVRPRRSALTSPAVLVEWWEWQSDWRFDGASVPPFLRRWMWSTSVAGAPHAEPSGMGHWQRGWVRNCRARGPLRQAEPYPRVPDDGLRSLPHAGQAPRDGAMAPHPHSRNTGGRIPRRRGRPAATRPPSPLGHHGSLGPGCYADARCPPAGSCGCHRAVPSRGWRGATTSSDPADTPIRATPPNPTMRTTFRPWGVITTRGAMRWGECVSVGGRYRGGAACRDSRDGVRRPSAGMGGALGSSNVATSTVSGASMASSRDGTRMRWSPRPSSSSGMPPLSWAMRSRRSGLTLG